MNLSVELKKVENTSFLASCDGCFFEYIDEEFNGKLPCGSCRGRERYTIVSCTEEK